MRSVLILFFCGLAAGAAVATSACSGDDEASTLGVGGFGTGSTGDGGNMCPTDGCGSCPAGQTCCNNACVDLNRDLNNCGQCCKACPNPHPVCDASGGTPTCINAFATCQLQGQGGNGQICADNEFCCDMSCCPEGNVCCPNGDGTYSCAAPGATGACP